MAFVTNGLAGSMAALLLLMSYLLGATTFHLCNHLPNPRIEMAQGMKPHYDLGIEPRNG